MPDTGPPISLVQRRLAHPGSWTWSARYLAAFSVTVVAAVAAFYLGLLGLAVVDRLPAPPVSGTWCIDEKLAWMRAHRPQLKAGVVAVGSSASWRNLDFGAVPEEARASAGGTVNAAPCYLRMNQIRFLANFLLDLGPGIRTMLMVATLRDFEECTSVPAAIFDPALTRAYLDGAASWWIYFRNFRPIPFLRFVKNKKRLAMELVVDEFGSAPLTKPVPETGEPWTPEAECYRQLRGMADDLAHRGVRLVVITFPTMAGWAALYDRNRAVTAAFRRHLRSALAGTGAILIDAAAEWKPPDADFADPVHLQWPAVAAFTRHVWDAAARAGAFGEPSRAAILEQARPEQR